MCKEPLYSVIAYTETQKQPLLLAEDLPHRQAWQTARKAMDENALIYAVSVRVQKTQQATGGNDEPR